MAKYAKSKLPSEEHIQKYKELLPDTATLNSLSYLTSLSIALLSHRPKNIDFEIGFKDGVLAVKSEKSMYLSRDAVKKLSTIDNLTVDFR